MVGGLLGFIGMSAVAGLLVTAAVTPALAVTGMAASDSIGMFENLPSYLEIDPLAQGSTIYANQAGNAVPIATFYSQNRVNVGWDAIAPVVKDAAVASEDPRFYEHGGVDLTGTIRGAMMTALHRDVQGGSSITQQYVKNVLVQKCESITDKTKHDTCYHEATKTTPERKLKEMRLAISVEKKYSKDTILLNYLNITGFGGSVYGIEAAAHYYFNVAAKDLNLEQSATLIAMINNPNNLRIDEPANKVNGAADGYKLTKVRRDYVIDRMAVHKKITPKQQAEAKATPITPAITERPSGCATAVQYAAGHFCDYVEHVIKNDPALGKTSDDRYATLARGGLKVYTTLDLDLQAVAQDAISSRVPPTRDGIDLGSAAVSAELNTGRIITMVQNRPFNNTSVEVPGTTAVNYNTDIGYGGSEGFQTGSAYKAFSLVAWLQSGHSLNQVVDGTSNHLSFSQFHNSCEDIGGGVWNVANDEGPGGRYSVLEATAESVNTVFAKMGTMMDLCSIKKAAESLGVHEANGEPLQSNPSSILGTNYISPLTMATAFGGIANAGKVCTPVAIDKIVKLDGTELPATPSTCTQGIDPKVAAGVTYALQGPMTHGTATAANPRDGIPIMGKTGTTDESLENWLVTSTSKIATATWVGNIQGSTPLRSLSFDGTGGANIKFYIARQILTALNARYGGDDFPSVDNSLRFGVQVQIPDLRGKSANEAKSILEGIGLDYQDGGATDSELPSGQVASSDPAAGSSIGKGSNVTVYTSNQSLVAVPNVVGQKQGEAQANLKSFQVTSDSTPTKDRKLDGTVASMTPAAGSFAKPGTPVKLTIYQFGAAPPDNG